MVWFSALDPLVGRDRYTAALEYMYPDTQDLQESIDKYFTEHSEQNTLLENVPDADGFTTVVHGPRARTAIPRKRTNSAFPYRFGKRGRKG